jgi:hypothetical protein
MCQHHLQTGLTNMTTRSYNLAVLRNGKNHNLRLVFLPVIVQWYGITLCPELLAPVAAVYAVAALVMPVVRVSASELFIDFFGGLGI